MITLRQLQCLLAVAEHLHFRRAAEKLNLSQPALSAHMAQLEDHLGVLLLERSRRKVMLTQAGHECVARARAIMAEVTELQDAMRQTQKPLSGTLKVGGLRTLGPYLLPHFLPRLRQDYPDLKLYLREEPRQSLMRELISGELDVALVASPPEDDRHLSVTPLFQEPLWAALPLGHALAAQQRLGLFDLKGEKLILLEWGDGLRQPALDLCRVAGAAEHPDFHATSLDSLRQMVATGLGPSLLPGLYVAAEALADSQIAVRPFDADGPSRTIFMVWRRTTARSDELRLLRQVIADNLPDAVTPIR